MTELDTSIPLKGVAPDSMTKTLSDLLSVKGKMQDIDGKQIQNTSNQMTLNERQHISRVLSDPQSYTDETGNVDNSKLFPMIMKGAPTTGSEAIQKIAESQKSQTMAQEELNKLSDSSRQHISSSLSTLKSGSTPDDVNPMIDALGDVYKGMAPVAEQVKKNFAIAYAQGKGDQYLAQVQNSVFSKPQQQEINTPNGVAMNDGQRATVINTKPGVDGYGQGAQVAGVQMQPPPTAITTNPDGSTSMYGAQPPLQVPGSQNAQGGNQAGAPQITSNLVGDPRVIQQQLSRITDPQARAEAIQAYKNQLAGVNSPQQSQGQQQPNLRTGMPLDTSELMMTRAAANQAAASVGDSRSNNMQIKEVLKNTEKDFLDPTGKAAANIKNIASSMGFAVGGDAASNYNSIAHNLALQQQTRNQQMGVKTDAGSAISGISSGSPEQDRKTLTKAVNISEAGNTGIEMFNSGMETAIKSGGLPAVRDFKNAWSQNYDVNALRLANAHLSGDKQETEDVIKLLGGKNSQQFRLAYQHATNLEMLRNGKIPMGGN